MARCKGNLSSSHRLTTTNQISSTFPPESTQGKILSMEGECSSLYERESGKRNRLRGGRSVRSRFSMSMMVSVLRVRMKNSFACYVLLVMYVNVAFAQFGAPQTVSTLRRLKTLCMRNWCMYLTVVEDEVGALPRWQVDAMQNEAPLIIRTAKHL